jgi:hypothetical protein
MITSSFGATFSSPELSRDETTPGRALLSHSALREPGVLNQRGADAEHWGQSFQYSCPRFSFVARAKQLPVASAEINSQRIQRICRQRVAQHSFVSSLLRQATH